MTRRTHHWASLIGMLLALATLKAEAQGVSGGFLYNLSDFSGTVPYSDVRLCVDRRQDEVFVLDAGVVRVFNDTGMEVYAFDQDAGLGSLLDIAVDETGEIYFLAYETNTAGEASGFYLARCNYRGDLVARIPLQGIPEAFSRIRPNALVYRNRRFYLASRGELLAIVVDRDGVFQRGYDLGSLMELDEQERLDTEIFGFNVDDDGNLLFTVPVLFKAFVLSPEGKLRSFGKVGSAPGLFGIVSGIASDEQGNYLLTDKLRCVVMIFDRDLRFVREFGGYGNRPGNLIRPSNVSVGRGGKAYVTQSRNRGVAVFALSPIGADGKGSRSV